MVHQGIRGQIRNPGYGFVDVLALIGPEDEIHVFGCSSATQRNAAPPSAAYVISAVLQRATTAGAATAEDGARAIRAILTPSS